MILLTGATGLIGSALLERLIESGRDVRCLVRDPTRLGPNRVRVQITLGDLADPNALRQAVRGVDSVVHLAATIRDQPAGSIEELNGVATIRLLRAAEAVGVRRLIFFGAIGATSYSSSRFFRAKALATRAVLGSSLDTRVLAPSIVYAPGDPFLTLLGRMSLLPWMPIAGSGDAEFEPIWAQDVAACALSALHGATGARGGRLIEIAGPEALSYEQIARIALDARHRTRPVLHVPMTVVRRGLDWLERLAGTGAFATPEEAELMELPMVSANGAADVRALGIEPRTMREVLGVETALQSSA